MNSSTTTIPQSADFTAQREYVQKLRQEGFDFSLMIAGAFVRGMREIGYKSSATAIDELIDNSIQAEARHVEVFWPKEAKPSAIAVADDGHGMEPDMTRVSVIWGGTHREDQRDGFGRFGYGLPSASIHLGRRFTVYSKVSGGSWHSVTIDVDDISEGKYTGPDGKIQVPEAAPASLPTWVAQHVSEAFGPDGLEHGTVVVIDKLDRLTPKTATTLRSFLLEKIGITYRNLLQRVTIRVDGEKSESTDPLFLTPGFRYYDIDDDRAEALPPLNFEVKDDNGNSRGVVKVRYSIMPPTFARVPQDKHKVKGGKNNPRFHVLDENNGLIILRNGRQIDVVTRPKKPFLGYINNDDRYWGVEIDFPATLDEQFSITTTKQQVVMNDRMWELLGKHGVFQVIREMRRRYDEAKSKLKDEKEAGQRRASEEAMENSLKFKTRPPADPADLQQRAEEGFQLELARRAALVGVSTSTIEPELRSELRSRKYRVDEESMPGAPFFRVLPVGGQRVLYLNTAHHFYTDVYKGPDSTPRVRAALEVLLFVLGDCEIEGTDEARKFYEVERGTWSTQLQVVLDELETNIGMTDVPHSDQEDADFDAAQAAAAV